MPAKISVHISEVMRRVDMVQSMTGEQRTKAIYQLYHLFKAIQNGAEIIPPLIPKTDLATPLVEEYRKTLKPLDILDDDPGPFSLPF